MYGSKWVVWPLAWMMFCVGLVEAQAPSIEDRIQTRIEDLRQFDTLSIGNARIASTRVLADFYERRNFRPAWTDASATDDLFRAIRDSEQDGLDPADYHTAELDRLRAATQAEPALRLQSSADADLLQTDALIRLGYHFFVGKVDPERLDSHWNLSHEIRDLDPVVMVQTMIDSGKLYQAIEALKPQHWFYTRLKSALATYRTLQSRGGWQPVPPGKSLKRGMTEPRVPLLRQRLAMTGDLPEAVDTSSDTFDDGLEAAVLRFQKRHRIEEDGVVGPGTLAALNVPVAQRINQLRVNLERSRWVLHDLPNTFVVVNIAGFRVYLIRNGERAWETRAVVGANYHKTPVFKSSMQYIVFNPTWTVPRSITVKEMLPKVKRAPDYLLVRNIDVIDSAGNVIDQSQLNWTQYDRRNFPYILRQRPGANNALGQVKFIFPNPYSVFLHDTPSKGLFSKARRNFSHGCIRVQNPLKFAEVLLNDATQWYATAIQQVVVSGKTQTVFLPEPLPVLLLYWTAEVEDDGTVSFMTDIYNRDPAVLNGLRDEFKIRKRDVVRDVQQP